MPPTDPTGPWPEQQVLLTRLAAWMSERRWFPLKDEQPPDGAALRVVADSRPAPGVRDLVVAVPRAGRDPVLMHVPLVLDSPGALERLTGAGEAPGAAGFALPDGTALVDGPHHPSFWRAWARAALAAGTTLRPEATTAVVQRAERLRVTTGEQSNTSVILPAPSGAADAAGAEDAATEGLIIKLFRVLAPGRNPDVEVSVALARDGWDQVSSPVAWSTLSFPDPVSGEPASADSAVAAAFIPDAEDGFALFCSLAGSDDGEAGGTRARAVSLAADLGVTTARMHEHLAAAMGTADPGSPADLAAALGERASWALGEVPELARAVPDLEARVEAGLDELRGLEGLPAKAAATAMATTRARHPRPRRLPPGPDPARQRRAGPLVRPGLRGRAPAPAGRSLPPRPAAAGRGGDAAVLRLRGRRRRGRRPRLAAGRALRLPGRLPLGRAVDRSGRTRRRCPHGRPRARQGPVRGRLRGAQPSGLAEDSAERNSSCPASKVPR